MKRKFSLIAVLTLLVAQFSAHADSVNSRSGSRKPANSHRQGLTSVSKSAGPKTIALTPIIGGYSGYTGNWAKDILNPYTLGFSVELATNRHSGFETLAFHSHYHVNHQSTEHKGVGTDERGIADGSLYQILGSLKFEL